MRPPASSSISAARGELFHAVHVGRVDVLAQRPQRHGAVHGAGIDIGEAQPRGQAPGDGALSRARRAVDGDDDLALCPGFGPIKSRITSGMTPRSSTGWWSARLARIPARFRRRLANVALVVEREPSPAQLARGRVRAAARCWASTRAGR